MIKVKHHTEDSLAQSLSSFLENSLTLQISSIKGTEDSYLKAIHDNLRSLIQLTALKVVVKKHCILQGSGYAVLAAGISQLSNLTSLSIEIQGFCLIEGHEIEALTSSFLLLKQLRELTIKVESYNLTTNYTFKRFIGAITFLKDLTKLDISFSQIYYEDNQERFEPACRQFNCLQSLLFFKLYPCFLRNEDLIMLLDEVQELKKLEHFEITLSGLVDDCKQQFKKIIQIVRKLSNLKIILLNIPEINPISEEQLNEFLEGVDKQNQLEVLDIQSIANLNLEKYGQTLDNLMLKSLNINADIIKYLNCLQNKGSLETLFFTFQKMKNPVDQQISQFSHLLSAIENLQSLTLQFQNKINETQDEELAKAIVSLKILKSLKCSISCSGHYNYFLDNIKHLKSLKSLFINSNYLNISQFDILIQSTSKLQELEYLDLSPEDQFQKIERINYIFKGLRALTKLKSLSLYLPNYSYVTEQQDEYLEEQNSFCNLEKLELKLYEKQSYSAKDVQIINNLSFLKFQVKLIELKIEYTQSHSESIRQIKFLTNLQKLEIRPNFNIPYKQFLEVVDSFQYLPQLTKLQFEILLFEENQQLQEQQEDQIIISFSKLTNLRKLKIVIESNFSATSNLLFSAIKELNGLQKLSFFNFGYQANKLNLKDLQLCLENNSNLTELYLRFPYQQFSQSQIKDVQAGISKLVKLEQLQIDVKNFDFTLNDIVHTVLNNLKQLSGVNAFNDYSFYDYDPFNFQQEEEDLYYQQNQQEQQQLKLQEETGYLEVVDDENCLVDEREDVSKQNNNENQCSVLQSINLNLERTKDNKNNKIVNQILSILAKQRLLSVLKLRLTSKVAGDSLFQSQIANIFKLKRLTKVTLMFNGVDISEDLKIKIQNSREFFQNIEKLELFFGDCMNFASDLFEGIKYSKHLQDLDITVSTFTNENAMILGESLKQLSQLISFRLIFIWSTRRNTIIGSSGIKQLVSGIKSLKNISKLDLNFESNDEISQEDFRIDELFANKVITINLQLTLNLKLREFISLFNEMTSILNLQCISIYLGEFFPVTQTMFDQLIIAAEELQFLNYCELTAPFSGKKLTFSQKMASFQNRYPVNELQIFIRENFELEYLFFKISLMIDFKQMEAINFDFWKYNSDITQISLTINDSNFTSYNILLKDIQFISSPKLNLSMNKRSKLYQECISKIIPYLNSLQSLRITISTELSDINHSLEMVEKICQLNKLFSLSIYRCFLPQILNRIKSRAFRLVHFYSY